MACGASGGDALALHMAIAGMDFVDAAKDLGAWVADGRPGPITPTRLSPRDALTALASDLHLVAVIISDLRRGTTPSENDWRAFLGAARRVLHIAEAAR
jgi:hypothetical protein